ncbi:putative regulatory protein [Prevotella sp. CAG:1058]|nr:putative regulatory protein [Prevotella sp. CAG:1058]
MEKDIFEYKYGENEIDEKLKSFVVDTKPVDIDMSNIKKKTYAKIRRDNERRMARRKFFIGVAFAACITLLIGVFVVPRSILSGVTEHKVAIVKPKMITTTVPVGEIMTFRLPDGTKIVANSRSIVKYPEKFTNDTRDIYTKGEVYLEVAHDKEHPFIVHSDGFDLKVLGTKFNIVNYNGHYSNVVLVEGAVEVTTKSRDKVTMRPNQLLNVSGGKLDGLKNVDTSQYTSWMNGIMNLHGDNIHQVVSRINDYYGTEIGVQENISGTPLYGKMVYQKDVDEVLKAINAIVGTKVSVVNGKVYLTK